MVLKSILLFLLAAIAEIGGAWLVWQGVREHKGWAWIGAGVIALGLYGFVATLQPDAHFGRILAAYGGVFVSTPAVGATVSQRVWVGDGRNTYALANFPTGSLVGQVLVSHR